MDRPEILVGSNGGAGNEVTGSLNIMRIKVNGKIYYGLFDCGIIQGKNERENLFYPIDGKKLDFVVVTHAHADHFLGLPLLKEYTGKIYGTKETFAQGYELLEDAVKKNERDAAYQMGITQEEYSKIRSTLYYAIKNEEDNEYVRMCMEIMDEIKSYSLYGMEDVERIAKHFCPVEPYTDIKIADEAYLRLVPMSSHQNGAVSVELYVGDYGENAVNMIFSGDIGPEDSLLYQPMSPKKNPLIHYAYLEGTHGVEERPQSVEQAVTQIEKLVFEAIRKNKTLVIAGFALDRLAQLLYTINLMIDKYNISIPIYFDSPLASRELVHYQNFYRSNSKSFWFQELANEPFDTSEVIVTNKYRDHEKVFTEEGAKVILTSSAFGEGGRILDYFDKYIQNPDVIFVFTGWLSPDCDSNKLLQAEEGSIVSMKMGNYVKKCQTVQVQGFTSHGYYPEMKAFVNRFPNLKGLVINHGDIEAKEAIVQKLHDEGYVFPIVTPDVYHNEESDKAFMKFTSEEMHPLSMVEGIVFFKEVLSY